MRHRFIIFPNQCALCGEMINGAECFRSRFYYEDFLEHGTCQDCIDDYLISEREEYDELYGKKDK